MTKRGPYRGGRVHVLTEKCSTCVFRPGNLMSLAAGRLKDLADDNRRADTALTCHQTLPYNHYEAEPAICRGYFDAYAEEITPLRMAVAIGIIEQDQPPTQKN